MTERKRIRKMIIALILPMMISISAGCFRQKQEKIPVQVLILPKFEVGEITGDFPGEAQYFYEEYLAGGNTYEIETGSDHLSVYYKDGIALCLTGQGKVSAALNTSAVLSDNRFDYSDAYILSVGCGGSAEGYGIFGDVYVISAAVDFDLGHKADPREMSGMPEATWFHDESFDDRAFIRLDENLTDRVYEQVKNVRLQTTEKTMKYLQKEYPGEEWADREPKVMPGTSVTGDNFWKGSYDHQNALLITETYGCRDPFSVTEMEDIAVAHAAKQAGLLDRLIILRVSVNMDVFPDGVTPELLWGGTSDDNLASAESMESLDIFEPAMQNCFITGKALIDAIREGSF